MELPSLDRDFFQCGEAHLAPDSGCVGQPVRTIPKKETDQMLADEVRMVPSLGESIPFLASGRPGCVAQLAYGPTGPFQTEPSDGPKTSSARAELSRYRFRSRLDFRSILRPEAERMHAERESAKPESRMQAPWLKESSALAPGRREESLPCIHRRLADAVACPRCDRSQ